MRIPVVFAFDDNYALPASIAIASLLEHAKHETEYDIIVLHGGLKRRTMEKMRLVCPSIRWIKVDAHELKDAPRGWSGLETYYRLLMAELLPDCDKVIWSDVDVLFKCDLAELFAIDLGGSEWAGIPAERRDERNGVHTHFEGNSKPYVYMPGLMVANLKLWREKNLQERFFATIRDYGSRLKMFDLDVLNLAARDIRALPFDYCVLENVYLNDDITRAKEWPWLSNTYSKEALLAAKAKPRIIHFAGTNTKIWLRPPEEISDWYWTYICQSPFYRRSYYYPTLAVKLEKAALTFAAWICPVKKWRKRIRTEKKRLSCR